MEKTATVLGAFDAHKVPSQAQTNAWIDWAVLQIDNAIASVDSNTTGIGHLSTHGQTLAKDLKDLLLAYKDLGEHKNGDDQLQNAIWNLAEEQINVKAGSQTDTDAAKNEAVTDAQRLSSALQNILVIFWNHFTSFGDGAGGLASLARNVLADAAEAVEQQAGTAKVQLRETEDEVQKGERDSLGRERKDDDSADDPRRKFESGMDTVKTTGSQAIGAGQSAKQGANEFGEKTTRNLEDLLDTVLERAQNDPAYRDSVSTVFDLADKWFNKSVDAADTTSINDFVDDPSGRIPTALSSLDTVLQRLADGKSTNDFTRALRVAAVDVREDQELRSFFDDLNEFVRRTVHEPTYARSEEHSQRRTQLRERWTQLQNGEQRRKWHDDLDNLSFQARDFLNKIEQDEDVRRLTKTYAVLSKDIAEATATFNEVATGEANWLWQDAVDVILPRVLQSLKQLPIPRTEYKDTDTEFVIEDLNISSLRLLPGQAHVRNTTDIIASKTSPAADASTKVKSHTQLHFKGVQFTAQDVSFWYHDKTSNTVSEVSGLLGLSVPEKGVDIDISLGTIPQSERKKGDSNQHAFFTVEHVKVKLNKPTITLRKTNHPILLTAFKPMFRSRLESSLETSLEQQITAAIHFMDGVAYDVNRRAQVFRDTGLAPSGSYLSAIWSEIGHLRSLPGPFSGLTTTSVGVVRDDARSDVKFAVGTQPQIIPGEKHGPEVPGSNSQGKRDQAVRLAEESKGRKDEAGDRVSSGVASFAEEVKIKKEQERQTEGWKTTAFDAPR